jgi:hypothetical protein
MEGYLDWLFCVDGDCSAVFAEVVDDGLGLLVVGFEPFLDDFELVIHSSACFAAGQQSFGHTGLSTLESHDEWDYNIWVHVHVPFSEVLVVSGEAVDEEATLLPAQPFHFCL